MWQIQSLEPASGEAPQQQVKSKIIGKTKELDDIE